MGTPSEKHLSVRNADLLPGEMLTMVLADQAWRFDDAFWAKDVRGMKTILERCEPLLKSAGALGIDFGTAAPFLRQMLQARSLRDEYQRFVGATVPTQDAAWLKSGKPRLVPISMPVEEMPTDAAMTIRASFFPEAISDYEKNVRAGLKREPVNVWQLPGGRFVNCDCTQKKIEVITLFHEDGKFFCDRQEVAVYAPGKGAECEKKEVFLPVGAGAEPLWLSEGAQTIPAAGCIPVEVEFRTGFWRYQNMPIHVFAPTSELPETGTEPAVLSNETLALPVFQASETRSAGLQRV